MDMYSRFQRIFAVTSDQFGVDPLQDKLIPHIVAISVFTIHQVTQDERAAPDLISLREYGTEEFWWILMAFNGLSSYKTITEGSTLKIPSAQSIIACVTENAIRPNRVSRVITI